MIHVGKVNLPTEDNTHIPRQAIRPSTCCLCRQVTREEEVRIGCKASDGILHPAVASDPVFKPPLG